MRILLISAYEARSHRAWAKTLMQGLNEHNWTYLALPPRHFAWRIRGNALSFAFDPEFKTILEQEYDLVIATSMTDCVGLKAFCPNLQPIPWVIYFHENQFAYPFSDKQQGIVEMQMVTLYSALAANVCLFNSEFNQTSFFEGARALLKKLPDYASPDWLDSCESLSQVVPVPLDQLPIESLSPESGTPKIRLLWSARWEFDKGPDRLLAILKELERRDLDYDIAILGERFRSTPTEFDAIEAQFSHRIRQFGYAPSREEYLQFLASSNIVLSTALHEFQGLAVLEAVALGCVPVLPNRQVYPELFAKEFLYECDEKDLANEASKAVNLIETFSRLENLKAPSVATFYQENILPRFARMIGDFALRKA